MLVTFDISCSMIYSLIQGCLWPLVFVLNNIWYQVFGVLQSITSQDVFFLHLDLLSEYRIQHGAIGTLYITSRYSTWMFGRGVSGFTTDCPCGVWWRGLSTCRLYVCPLFGNRLLNNSQAVGLRWWIVYLHVFFLYFEIYNCICLNTSYEFSALSLLLK